MESLDSSLNSLEHQINIQDLLLIFLQEGNFYAYAELEADELEEKKKEAAAAKVIQDKIDALNQKKNDFKQSLLQFSKTLNQSDYDQALEKKTNLIENDNVPREDLDKIRVTTDELYKKHFTFPEVAKNDFASE